MSHEKKEAKAEEKAPEKQVNHKPKCGIVMPISPLDGCTADHWKDVLAILKESIEPAGFEPNLVSEGIMRIQP